jgi:hypothetical protein
VAHPVFKDVFTTAVGCEDFPIEDRHDLRQIVSMGDVDLSIPTVGQLVRGIPHEEAELTGKPHATGWILHITVDHGDVPATLGQRRLQQLPDLLLLPVLVGQLHVQA